MYTDSLHAHTFFIRTQSFWAVSMDPVTIDVNKEFLQIDIPTIPRHLL